jgi:hypothetical protein
VTSCFCWLAAALASSHSNWYGCSLTTLSYHAARMPASQRRSRSWMQVPCSHSVRGLRQAQSYNVFLVRSSFWTIRDCVPARQKKTMDRIFWLKPGQSADFLWVVC